MAQSKRQKMAVRLIALVLLTGCAQAPTEQLQAAQHAVDEARAAGAPDYAKDDLVKLEQQLALATYELTRRENVLSMFRSYADAEKMLITVVESAGPVAAKAAQNKMAAKTAVLAMGKEAGQVVASAKALIAKAPTGNEWAALDNIKRDVEGLETSFNAVYLLIEMGDYVGAEVQARAVKENGTAVSREIQRAIDRTKEMQRSSHS
jgi:hypothetical protein